jgi:hypothetical protein
VSGQMGERINFQALPIYQNIILFLKIKNNSLDVQNKEQKKIARRKKRTEV